MTSASLEKVRITAQKRRPSGGIDPCSRAFCGRNSEDLTRTTKYRRLGPSGSAVGYLGLYVPILISSPSEKKPPIPILTAHPSTSDVCQAEGQIPHKFGRDAVEIPGSRALLETLETARAPWAIVTSGTRPLVTGWLDVMRLAHPKFLVTAEEVEKGKPDPGPYLLGAKRLGLEEAEGRRVLVLEDAPAGVRAGKAAGFRVVALATTHKIGELKAAGADWIVRDMKSVKFLGFDGRAGDVSIEIRDALRV